MQGVMSKMCCLGISIILLLCAGCKEKETVTLQEVTDISETKSEAGDDRKTGDGEENASDDSDTILYIYVCGEVRNPGVYELLPGSRIYEAVAAAGGMTPEASSSYLNQAELLEDGERVYVPSKEEIKDNEGITAGTIEKDKGKINLNTATKEELMTLTGIGEAKAESIIRYRQENGSFRSKEDIMKIEGIKEGVFNKIKEQITV